MLSKHNSSSGRPTSDRMLVTAAARIGAIRQRRSSMPKIANEMPAATNNRSPMMPCAPMVLQRFDADDAKPEHDGQRAGDAAPAATPP